MTDTQDTTALQPLHGIRVLDFTHALAGPYCTMLLSDHGAEVIKIEKPGRGDGSRHFRMSGKYGNPDIGSDYYLAVNRNKKSVCVDMGSPEGVELIKELAKTCDIVVQNFRPDVMDRLGIGYDALKEINPGVIYCDISAFPSGHPMEKAPGMDIVIQACAGSIAITGNPGGEPIKPGPSISDLSGALQALNGILFALRVRDQQGLGQRISVNLYHTTMAMLVNYSTVVLNSEEDVAPMGNGHPQLAPYQAFQGSDGWFFIAVGTNELWRRFCKALDIEALQDDPRFSGNWQRVSNKAELAGILGEIFAKNTVAHWLETLDAHGVPASPIVTPRGSHQAELARGSTAIGTVDHPDYGITHLPGNPVELSLTPGHIDRYPPRLGEDTDAVLAEALGLDDDRLAALKAAKVVAGYGEMSASEARARKKKSA